jgi:hypothetical protein
VQLQPLLLQVLLAPVLPLLLLPWPQLLVLAGRLLLLSLRAARTPP